MPALQDILEDFDVSKLEEFAESLLADVHTELEDASPSSGSGDAQNQGAVQRVSGPMVGSSQQFLESSKVTQGSSIILNTHNYSKSPFEPVKAEPLDSIERVKVEPIEMDHEIIIVEEEDEIVEGETVFGAYDENTNCITIVEMPYEAVEEIVTDDKEFKVEPLLSPIPSRTTSVGYESHKEDLRPKSPFSLKSDCGYESLASPSEVSEDIYNFNPNLDDGTCFHH